MKIESNERTWTIVLVVGLVALALVTIYGFAVPNPKPPLTVPQQKRNLAQARVSLDSQTAQLKQAEADNSRFLWPVSIDEITSQTMESMSEVAKAHKVQVQAIRPQKIAQDSGLQLVPYSVIINGPFPGVHAFLKDIEAPKYRLAVSMVQLAAADASSDQVNATISVIAYMIPSTQVKSNATAK